MSNRGYYVRTEIGVKLEKISGLKFLFKRSSREVIRRALKSMDPEVDVTGTRDPLYSAMIAAGVNSPGRRGMETSTTKREVPVVCQNPDPPRRPMVAPEEAAEMSVAVRPPTVCLPPGLMRPFPRPRWFLSGW